MNANIFCIELTRWPPHCSPTKLQSIGHFLWKNVPWIKWIYAMNLDKVYCAKVSNLKTSHTKHIMFREQ